MWESLISLVVAVAGMFIVLGVWFAIQTYVRWRSRCHADTDLLEYLAHGCSSCKGPESCGQKKTEEHHHELI